MNEYTAGIPFKFCSARMPGCRSLPQPGLRLLALLLLTLIASAPAQSSSLKDMLPSSLRKQEAPKAFVRDKWALLIAADSYQDPSIESLPVSAANIACLSDWLKDPQSGRFAGDHLLVLTGDKATRGGIEDGIENWLVKKALPGDLVLIYVCSRSALSAAGAPLILPADTMLAECDSSAISLNDLLCDLRRRIQSPYILCLLDLNPCREAQSGARAGDLLDLSHTGVSILSAAAFSCQSYALNKSGPSLFVQQFVEGERVAGGAMPISLVADYVGKNVPAAAEKFLGKPQKPFFSLPPDNALVSQVALGIPVKSSLPHPTYSLGHPVDQLAINRPDIVPPRGAAQPKSQAPSLGKQPLSASGARDKLAARAKIPASAEPAEEDEEEPLPPVDFGPYMKTMKEDIQKNWHPPQNLESRHLVAVFTIRRDGTILNPSLVEGSGVEALDKSALEALRAASPLAPLPPGSPHSVDIRYKFDWQLHKN